MSDKQPRYAMYFHKFMIFFALWVFAAFAAWKGVWAIRFTLENGVSNPATVIIPGALLILLGMFLIKARFDLAAYRASVPVEMLVACLAGAGLVGLVHLLLDVYGAFEGSGWILEVVIFACWGIALYRYYKQFPDLFVN